MSLQTQRKELPGVIRHKPIGQRLSVRRSEAPLRPMGSTIATAPAASATSRTLTIASPKYRGMLSGMATIAREEGIKGLWKGNMAAEYLYLTYGGIQFLIYKQTKSTLAGAAELSMQSETLAKGLNLSTGPWKVTLPISTILQSSSTQSFLSGSTAGIMATACTYPFDLLRTRFAVQRDVKVYTGVLQAFGHIFRNDGITGFYRGMSPALIQVIPYMGVMFASYDTLKQTASWLKQRADLSAPLQPSTEGIRTNWEENARQILLGLEDMVCGGLSGVISKTTVYPLDMVRKRLQIQGSAQQQQQMVFETGRVYASATHLQPPLASMPMGQPTTVWRCMIHIVRHEGYLALYKGLTPGLLKAAPSSAVTFLVFSKMGAFVEHARGSRS
ncbi:mitochondrial thiamine pyrophosphate transporter [Lunasporangiospora selenospora]|uniref:Mitochondrial thiamine pyrophosphate transporter n=1 Tax=Lunasporangiospora selenospora TaxID=979761 RepID=A0A9P6KHP8_9FUNG|nr:mitochondrial thiamine pyrophosphate transporter [Lunasporangiospora selenospora]